MKQKEVDLSDSPELTPAMFARAVVRQGLKARPRKVQLSVRLDSDVLAWLRARGRGYQTLINALLRAYMDEHARAHGKATR